MSPWKDRGGRSVPCLVPPRQAVHSRARTACLRVHRLHRCRPCLPGKLRGLGIGGWHGPVPRIWHRLFWVGKPAMGDGWRGWGTDGVGLAEGRSPSPRSWGLSMGRAVGWSWRGGEDGLALRRTRLGEPANLGRTLFDHGAGPHLCGVFRGRVGDWLRFAPGFRPTAECLPGFHEKGPSAEAEGPETRTKEGGSPRGNLRMSSSARRRPDRSPCRTRRWRCSCRSRCRRSNPPGSGSRRGSTRGRRRTPRTSG